MIVNKRTLIILLFLSQLLNGCVDKLQRHEYIEVERREKALLIAESYDALDLCCLLIPHIKGDSWSLSIGDEKWILIEAIDGVAVHRGLFGTDTGLLVSNKHVLIEPGTRCIRLKCHIKFKDRNKPPITAYNNLVMDFKGGFTYVAKIAYIEYPDYSICSTTIELEKGKYNKSLNLEASQDTPSAN